MSVGGLKGLLRCDSEGDTRRAAAEMENALAVASVIW